MAINRLMGTAIILALALMTAVSCTSGKIVLGVKPPTPLSLENNPKRADFSQFPAVVLIDEQEVGISRTWSGKVSFWKKCRKAVKMFRNSDRYAVFEISAYQDERIASITAETIDPHGAVKIVQPSDITWTENNAHNGTLENIVKTALVSFPGADSGSILYCQWSIESESSMFNIDWRYQSKLPVMEANTRDYGDFRSVITAAERFYRKAPLFEKNQFGIAAK